MTAVVVVTPAELRELISEAVSEAVAELAPADTPPVLVDGVTLARMLSVSRTTVHRLRVAGMPAVKLGDTWRFRPEECLRWLEGRSR